MDFVAIPEDRVGALIGKDGSAKKKAEKSFGVKLNIENNRVGIDGEAINVLKARDYVAAVSRGFSPQRAMKLESDENVLEMMDLSDMTDKERIRLRSRIIGSNGKARKQLESMTEVSISVYGKTVSLIGRPSDVSIAKEAISLLLDGSPHGTVYKMISKKRQETWQ